MRFGVHVSIQGGLHKVFGRGEKLGCDTIQFFLVNPRGWSYKPLDEDVKGKFLEEREAFGEKISPLVVHIPYLPNLSSLKDDIFDKSITCLHEHLNRCEALGIDYLVMHMGKGDPAKGYERMREGLLRAFNDEAYSTTLLLENTAGQGKELGSSVEKLAEFCSKLPDNMKSGLCIDTCHAYAAGYDIATRTGIRKMNSEINKDADISMVKLIHVNDSLKGLGKKVDRHAGIGQGFIGEEGFQDFLGQKWLQKVPCILETPRTCDDDDIYNLSLIRKLSQKERK